METTKEMPLIGVEELEELVNALNLSSEFSLYLLTCDTPAVGAAVLALIQRKVAAKRGEDVELVHLDPYRAWTGLEAPIPREVLAREVLERISRPSREASAENAIHIINASGAIRMDGESWLWLFHRMNEQRNVIAENIKRELIVLVPPWLVNSFRQDAADFWSVRSGDLRILAGPLLADPSERSPWSWEPMDVARRDVQRVSAKHAALGREAAQGRVIGARTPQEQVSALTHMADVCTKEAIAKIDQARAELDALRRAEALACLDEAVKIRHEVIRLVASSAQAATANKPTLDADHARAYLAATLIHRGYVLYEDGRFQQAKADGASARDLSLSLLGDPRLDQTPAWGKTAQVPEEPGWWSDLALALILVGDVELGNLDPDAALRDYEASLHVAMRFADRAGGAGGSGTEGAASVGLPEWKRLLSIALDRVGDARFARGDLGLAMQAYGEALAIAVGEVERAAREVEEEAAPSSRLAKYSLLWKRDRSVAEINLGDVHRASGRMDAAIQAYLSALTTRRELLQRDSRRPEWIRDVAIALQRLGQVHAARGDQGRAQIAYAEAITRMRGLVQADPERAAWRLELIFLLERHGSLLMERGEVQEARSCFEEALTLTRDASGRSGTSPAWREGQRRVLQGLHEALIAAGDREGSRVIAEALRDASLLT